MLTEESKCGKDQQKNTVALTGTICLHTVTGVVLAHTPVFLQCVNQVKTQCFPTSGEDSFIVTDPQVQIYVGNVHPHTVICRLTIVSAALSRTRFPESH